MKLNRAMPRRSQSESDAVVRDEVEEITDRIDLMERTEAVASMSDEALGKVLASFEEQLLELNQALKNVASGKIVEFRKECSLTRRAVSGLSSELDDVVKGQTG